MSSRALRWLCCGAGLLALASPVDAKKFYPDDPLLVEPPLVPTAEPGFRDLSSLLELFANTVGKPGERQPESGVIPAMGVNTLGDVMDGPWYVNRHGRERMSREELARGPGDAKAPSTTEPWRVLTVKPYGTLPGILIADAEDRLYLLQHDPEGHLEMATGAEIVASKFFYALGYFVPENYVIDYDRDQLVAAEVGESITSLGKPRELIEEDIDHHLSRIAKTPDGRFRAVATRLPSRWGNIVGAAQVYGTRSDDPNDIIPHEHRRDLRGLHVFAAWLNYIDASAVNILEVYHDIEEPAHIRRYLIDFGATLGSGNGGPKSAREGNDPYFNRGRALKNLAGMGVFTRRWMRASYPDLPSVGRFESKVFDPEAWIPDAMIAPFANRLPDDEFWAARQVMAFTDDDIRAIVATGEYSDPAAEAWLAECLIGRRDTIGETYFAKVLPLDRFRVEGGELSFDDLAAVHGLVPPRSFTTQWSKFDNDSESHVDIGPAVTSRTLPSTLSTYPDGSYVAARIWADDPEMHVVVYLRREGGAVAVVGLERNWPGKVIADPRMDDDPGGNRYADLKPRQRELIDRLAVDYGARAERQVTPEEFYDQLTISERTTFDGVFHALASSKLTDQETGESLGVAADLVKGIERIAGQYYGRGGDQQFRLYVHLEDGARATLERSKQFFADHENTVYHVGYPNSYRQEGKVPNIQFSISEDEKRADIDVDYRSSKSPQALFNGHLTSANSDIRAGDNLKHHNGRWSGFIAWWKDLFGKIDDGDGRGDSASGREMLAELDYEPPTPLPADRPPGAPIEHFADAVQEFLTDWLVRQDLGEAMQVVSDDILACVNADDDAREEILAGADARDMLRKIMQASAEALGERFNLTEAIDAVATWDEDDIVIDHAFKGEFEALELLTATAEEFLCEQPASSRAALAPSGVYYAALFRFKVEGSGILGLLWTRQGGAWRLVSYEVYRQ